MSRWGGARVAEYTNATHTQLVELYHTAVVQGDLRRGCSSIWRVRRRSGSSGDGGRAAERAAGGAAGVSRYGADCAGLSRYGFGDCGDSGDGDDWAYISSGTWSLVGTLLEQPRNGAAAAAENFTNLGAVGGRICFHKNVNGMWLIRQCMDKWAADGRVWTVPELVAAAEKSGEAAWFAGCG